MKNSKRKHKLIGSALQNKILFIIFVAAVFPTTIAIVSLYYLIFNLLAWQVNMPAVIASNLMPVVNKINLIIFISLPLVLLVLWIMDLELSHRIAGPVYRLEKDLDDRISGKASGPISLRKHDELKPLTSKINKLLTK